MIPCGPSKNMTRRPPPTVVSSSTLAPLFLRSSIVASMSVVSMAMVLKAVILRVRLGGNVVGDVQRQSVKVESESTVRSLGGDGGAEVLHVPVGGGFRIGRLEVNMVQRECHGADPPSDSTICC